MLDEKCDKFPLVNIFIDRPRRTYVCEKVADIVQLKKGLHVLEVGCADGSTSIFFAETYDCYVTGIDISSQLIKKAENHKRTKNIPNRCHFIVADAAQLPFKAQQFDLIYCEAVFSALENKNRVAREFSKVLRPKGKIVLVDFVLRRAVSKELQQRMTDIPCFSGARQLKEYIELFSQVNLKCLQYEDISNEIFKTGEYLAWKLGCEKKNMTHLSRKITSCYNSQKLAPSLIRRFLKDSKLGYYILIFGG